MKTYVEKFKDPRWQKKRLEIFERDEFKCVSCVSKDKELNAHHLCCIKGFDPWEYDNIFIITLCNDCHSYFHDNPSSSEYFLLREMNDAECELSFFENQKSYDIGGIMRFLKKDKLSIDELYFRMCDVDRKLNEEKNCIEFTLIENEDE